MNTASGSISSYSIANGGALNLLQSTPIKAAGAPEDARLSPDGRTLWVVDPTADSVSGFSVQRWQPHEAVDLAHGSSSWSRTFGHRRRLT